MFLTASEVFSIPKRLRIYFLFDRKLLAKLSVCAWNVIKRYLQSSVADKDAVPGTSIAVLTYGDFLNFNPHLHAIVSDGCFSKNGDFHMTPGFMLEDLEAIFQYEVLKMLKKEGKITDVVIENMLSWRHSGFHVYIGGKFFSDDNTAKVVYTSKDRKSRITFNALDWLARLVTHIPGRYEQAVRYYGYYSYKSRGLRKKANADNEIPTIILNEMSSKEFRQNWARLIALKLHFVPESV